METETDLKFINPWKLFTGAFTPNWLLCRKEISPGVKLCYALLCQYAGKKGECFPRQSDLAERLGVGSSRQVINYIKALERLKLIVAVKTRFQGRNVYKFLYHEWMAGLRSNVKDISHLGGESNFTIDVKDISHPNIIRDSIKSDSKEKGANPQSFLDYFNLKTNKTLKLTPQRRAIIDQRLKDGHTLEQLKKAVDAFIQDPWPERSKYTDIIYCIGVRNKVDNLERWLSIKTIKKIEPKQPDPNCNICNGSGKIPDGRLQGAICLCVK
jgi:uncharacterized phage protein (TIGR02220 family)